MRNLLLLILKAFDATLHVLDNVIDESLLRTRNKLSRPSQASLLVHSCRYQRDLAVRQRGPTEVQPGPAVGGDTVAVAESGRE